MEVETGTPLVVGLVVGLECDLELGSYQPFRMRLPSFRDREEPYCKL